MARLKPKNSIKSKEQAEAAMARAEQGRTAWAGNGKGAAGKRDRVLGGGGGVGGGGGN